MTTARQATERGQVLVVFALAIVVLLAAAGLAFDVGRFYSEKRFLQNAADAAALAAANALVRGATVTDAEAEARAILTSNFANSPNGIRPSLPPETAVYEDGHAGDASFLVDGILISGGDVRVAVRNSVGYTFGRIVGLDRSTIGGRARVQTQGNLLPIAVRRYVGLPGPNSGAAEPCPNNQSQFMDFFATANKACLGSETDAALRALPEPSAGDPFNAGNPGSDPVNHGPIVAILGQGAQPANGADFRGFVALDVRNFQNQYSQVYYNGVTSGTNPQTLKAMEAAWVANTGYPGPLFPPAVTPPDPNDQVAIMSGNSTGIAIDALLARFVPGDEILVAVYPGAVMGIPDFSIAPPGTLALPATGTVANAGSFKVSRNQAFSGTVTLSTVADTVDPNPLVGSPPITYTPQSVTPSLGAGTTVQMQNMVTAGATPGIYTLWIQGQGGAVTKLEPFAVNIGGVSRDFTISSAASTLDAANPGDVVSTTLRLKNGSPAFNGQVTLSVDGPLPPGMTAAPSFSVNPVTPSNGVGAPTTLTVSTGTTTGSYRLVVRASGTNADGNPVTHLLPITVRVSPSTGGGSQEYVDIVGFAVMRIAAIDANTVSAYAITPVVPDMNDPRLRRGQVARLVPWN